MRTGLRKLNSQGWLLIRLTPLDRGSQRRCGPVSASLRLESLLKNVCVNDGPNRVNAGLPGDRLLENLSNLHAAPNLAIQKGWTCTWIARPRIESPACPCVNWGDKADLVRSQADLVRH